MNPEKLKPMIKSCDKKRKQIWFECKELSHFVCRFCYTFSCWNWQISRDTEGNIGLKWVKKLWFSKEIKKVEAEVGHSPVTPVTWCYVLQDKTEIHRSFQYLVKFYWILCFIANSFNVSNLYFKTVHLFCLFILYLLLTETGC